MNILIKKSIPNFITLSNLFLGFTSIVLLSLSLTEEFYYISTACYLILISCALDTIDGKIARKLNISSDFGREIDSLADLVSFCIVPSLLIFVHYMLVIPGTINFILLILLSSFPLIFGAIRLAKYNALREMRDSQKYLGLPTPANAILVCSLILFTHNIPYRKGLEFLDEIGMGTSTTIINSSNIIYNTFSSIFINEYMILLISIISSILLMSKVNYEKFPLISFKINRKNSMDLLKLIFFLFILITSIYYKYYDLVLLIFIMIYIYGNLLKYIFLKLLNKNKEV